MKVLTPAFHTVVEYYWMNNLPEVDFYRTDIRDMPNWWGSELRPQPKNCHLDSITDYDIAIAHSPESYVWIKDHFNGPIIFWFHQYPDDSTLNKTQDLNLPKDIPTVYYSQEEADAWKIGTPFIIKHGIDCSLFNGWKGDVKKAVTINSSKLDGRWGEIKGFTFLQQLKELWSPVFYHIYGGDVYLQTEEEMLEVLRKYRLYMNFAWKLDRTPLEAMSCGMPVVARNTPQLTLKDFFKNGENIILVETPQEMKEVVLKLLEDQTRCLELGEAAKMTVKKYFSLEENAFGWLSLFEKYAKRPGNIPATGEGEGAVQGSNRQDN